jgi:hypothetical protein
VTVTVITTECFRPAPSPTTVTLYVPVVLEATVKIDDAFPLAGTVTLDLLNTSVGPLGDTLAVSPTPPENPSRLVTVIVEEADFLTAIAIEDGLAETEKSDTFTVTRAVCANDPLTPVTLTT